MRKHWCGLLALFAMSAPVPAVEVIDSGAFLGEYPVIRWMDNQQVIFLAASGQYCDRKDKPDSYKQPLNRITVFDIEARQLSPYGEAGINGLCYADGNISYARRRVDDGLCPKDEWAYFRGRIGEEKELAGVPLDTFSCLPEAEVRSVPAWLDAAKKSGRLFTALKAEHGWVEVGYPEHQDGKSISIKLSAHPIRIYAPGNDQGAPVGKLPPVGISPIWHYYPFKGAYLLEEWLAVYPTTSGVFHSWWLYSDGRVESALEYDCSIRKGDWRWDDLRIVPTRVGFLLTYVRLHKSTPFANAKTGLYRFRNDGNFEKLIAGSIGEVAVSPDGCRVALGVDDTYRDGREHPVLKVIDLCKD